MGCKGMPLCVQILSWFLNGSRRISCIDSLNQVLTIMNAVACYPSGAVLGNQSKMTRTTCRKDSRLGTRRQVSL